MSTHVNNLRNVFFKSSVPLSLQFRMTSGLFPPETPKLSIGLLKVFSVACCGFLMNLKDFSPAKKERANSTRSYKLAYSLPNLDALQRLIVAFCRVAWHGLFT